MEIKTVISYAGDSNNFTHLVLYKKITLWYFYYLKTAVELKCCIRNLCIATFLHNATRDY